MKYFRLFLLGFASLVVSGCLKTKVAAKFFIDVPAEGNSWYIKTDSNKTEFYDYKQDDQTNDYKIQRFYFRIEKTGQYGLAILNDQILNNLNVKVKGHSFEKTIELKKDISPVGQVTFSDTGYYFIDLEYENTIPFSKTMAKGVRFSGKIETPKISFITKDFFYWGRRGPSVHLSYPNEENSTDIEWFYNEVKVAEDDDVVGSFYMANGFKHGYFGIQTNSLDEKRVLFSVWSPFNTDDPAKIPIDQRVELLAKGKDVITNDFGNEGSGGQSYLRYKWKAGLVYKFLLRGKPEGNGKTVYSAWIFAPERNEWMFIAKWRRPVTDEYLSRHHSFLENFLTQTGPIQRKVSFSNQWICDSKGNWKELTKAKFTGDATAKAGERKDYAGGLSEEETSFYLSNCGFFNKSTPLDTWFRRAKSGRQPEIDFKGLEGY